MLKLPLPVEIITYCILIILAMSAAAITLDGLVKSVKDGGVGPIVAAIVSLLVLVVSLAGLGLLSYYS